MRGRRTMRERLAAPLHARAPKQIEDDSASADGMFMARMIDDAAEEERVEIQSLSDIGKKLEDESHFWQRRLRELSFVEICDLNCTHRYRQNQILDSRAVGYCDRFSMRLLIENVLILVQYSDNFAHQCHNI